MKKLFTLFAVAALAFAAQATTLTLCDADETSTNVPIYGLYVDTEGTMGQMIYPADMLTDMVGKTITEVQFYSPGINFSGATLQLGMTVTDQNDYADYAAVEGATELCSITPNAGDAGMTFVLDQPFVYEGGNLMVQVLVTEVGDWATTYFYGQNMPYYYSYYQYQSSWSATPSKWNSYFLPKVTFTYEGGGTTPTVQADAPEIGVTYGVEGNHVAYVNINSGEENATIYYSYDNENWMVYEGELLFTENGTYIVYAYVSVPGKLDSEVNAVQFVVTPRTGMTDVMTGKTIASQRYFNIAGQEMKEANGLTIVVTTFTDGTTNTVKVVK
jgi:hypothetical protein